MRILVTPYYKDKNPYRRTELANVLCYNYLVFDKIILVADSEVKPPEELEKINIVVLRNRPTWSDMIRAANQESQEDDIVVIANGDIYFEDLSKLDEIDFTDACLCLSRWDTKGSDYNRTVTEPTLYNSPDSQDAWVFKGKIKPIFAEFKFGIAGSDNRICFELGIYYYLYNPAKDIKCFHLHTVKENKYAERVPAPYKTIWATDLSLVPKIKKYGVLHIGMKNYTAEYGLCVSLQKLGNYDFIDWQQFHSTHEELNTPERKISLANELMEKCIGKDLIFMHIQTPNVINDWMLRMVKTLNHDVKIVNFNGDVRNEVPEYMYELGKECITLYTNQHDVDEMVKKGYDARYMNCGFDPELYKPEGDKYDLDAVVFIGNNYNTHPYPMSKFRYNMVVELKKEFGDKFKVYGNGWGDLSEGYVQATQEAAIYRSCKAVINVSQFEYPKYSSDRLHRAMGCGALILCKDFPQRAIEFGYSSMIIWQNMEDLKSWVKTVLEPRYGTNVSEEAMKFAHKYLTWDYLLNQLKNELDTEHKQLSV